MTYILEKNIEIKNALNIKRLLLKKIEDVKYKSKNELVIDFSYINLIDIIGLGILVSIYKRAIKRNIRLIFKNISPNVKFVFKETMLDEVFIIE